VKRLSSERQRLASEVQMKREMEQQYAKRCTLQVHVRPQCCFQCLHTPPTDACFPFFSFFARRRPLLKLSHVVEVVTPCLNLPLSSPWRKPPPPPSSFSPGPSAPQKPCPSCGSKLHSVQFVSCYGHHLLPGVHEPKPSEPCHADQHVGLARIFQ